MIWSGGSPSTRTGERWSSRGYSFSGIRQGDEW
jgi:hypothetical protein